MVLYSIDVIAVVDGNPSFERYVDEKRRSKIHSSQGSLNQDLIQYRVNPVL